MKPFFNAPIIVAFMAVIFSTYALAEEANRPPIAQPLVREGEFARQLVEVLRMMPAQTEAEAENMLTAAGIVPPKGWIADYPVTPDILSELEKAVQNAARSGAIGLDEEEAMLAFQGLKRDVGLEGVKGSGEIDAENEPPPSYESDSASAAAVERHYESEGPPIVTYYPPPYVHYGLYGWVPYPFWYSGVFFSGFFILRDFHRPIFVHKKAFVLSNHFFDRHSKRITTVTPHRRFLGDIVSSRGSGRGGGSGGEGVRHRGIDQGSGGQGPERMDRRGRDDGRSGSDSKSRGGFRNQSPPKFNRGSDLGGRDRFSSPDRTTGNHGGAIRGGGDFSRRTGSEVRSQGSFGGERRMISPSGRGSGSFFNSAGRQDWGGSHSFSGSRGGFFENRGSSGWGFSGGGSSFRGLVGGGGSGRR